MQNKNILRIALAVAFILLLLMLAMQLTGGGNWGIGDFVLAGAILFGTGVVFELVARKADNIAYRVAVGAALAGAFSLVWINLAVGIIGSEDNRANLLYIGVLGVLIIGALIAQFRPLGMSRVLFATALAHAVVALIALVAVKDLLMWKVLVLNGFYVALWLGSAWLFQRANAALNQRPE